MNSESIAEYIGQVQPYMTICPECRDSAEFDSLHEAESYAREHSDQKGHPVTVWAQLHVETILSDKGDWKE